MHIHISPMVRNILIAVACVVGLLLIAFVFPLIIPWVPRRFWQLVALCLAGLAILWWFTAGSRHAARAGRTRKRIGDLGPGNPDDEREPLTKMQQAIRDAKHTIQRSPEIGHGRNSLYRVPWLLFLGDAQADMDAWLRAASTVSPFPPPEAASGDAVWRWWFFKSMIAVDVAPKLVCDATARLERGLWYQALMQLAAEREMLPLNGIVVGIGAATLLGDAAELKAASMRLRRLVDEAMEHLQVLPPVYFVVTGLDALAGYEAFRAALPAEAFTQALGYRMPDNERVSAGSKDRLDSIMAPIVERLHALRMTALLAQADAPGRAGVFEFVQSIARLEPGLREFVGLLLEDNPFQRTPRWRGLYFTAGATQTHADGAFVADLVTRFLPSDQPLAATTLKSSGARLALAGVGVAALLAFSGYLSYGLVSAHSEDAHMLARTRSACAGRQSAGASGRIRWVASCGRTIEQLEVRAGNASFGFGLRRSDRDIAQLKQQVVADFSTLILAPYDQMLEADMARGTVGIEHLLAVAQRLRILENCRGSNADCVKREVPFNVVFDPRSRLFAPFETPGADSHTDRDNADALMTTYLGYLRWQKGSVLDDAQHRLRQQLRRLLTIYQPSPHDLEQWAAQRTHGQQIADFWLPAGHAAGVADRNLPTVSGAYTRTIWQGVVQPLLETIADNAPKKKSLSADFRKHYFQAYFGAWGRFQAGFSSGLSLWHGRYPELAKLAAGPGNPYRRYFARADAELMTLPLDLSIGQRWSMAWHGMHGNWFHTWRPLGHFFGGTFGGWFGDNDITPPPWLPAMQATRRDVLADQKALFANGYLRLQAKGSDQNLYHIVADFYRAQGKPKQPPASDYTKLVNSVAKPDDTWAARFKGNDLAAWSIVQGPSRLLLTLTVQRAARYLQGRWTGDVVAALKSLPPRQQTAALYGGQGKLNAFIKDWLQPFVTRREHAQVRIDGVALPLTQGFAGMLATQGQYQPLLDSTQPFMAGSFSFTGPSDLGMLSETAAGTTLEVSCQTRSFSATDKAQSLAGSSVAVFWSPAACLQASLTIHIAPSAPGANLTAMVDAAAAGSNPSSAISVAATPPQTAHGLTLVRIYDGADGFVQLLHDFGSGVHSFTLEDFHASYNPAQWRELATRLQQAGFTGVRVYLKAQPSDQMQRFIAARTTPVSMPARIIQ